MGTRRDLLKTLVAAALILLTAVAPAASAERRGQGWRNLRPAVSPSGRQECGREFHDLQSKWLQATLVIRARWLPADEQPPARGTHRFNVTVTILSVLKRSTVPRLSSIKAGSRIVVGEFSGALARRQRTRQRQRCTPSRLGGGGRKGYILFLTPTEELGYFRHSFLPVKFNQGSLAKLNRVSCNQPANCPKAPRLVKAIPKGLKPSEDSREISMRFVCRANGEPLPVVRWFKDGVEVTPSDRVKAQFKRRSHAIVSRLVVKPVDVTDAGTYTCQFSNLVGTVNASFEIEVVKILDTENRLPSKTTAMPSFMCGNENMTYCMNGGTCVINRLDGRPQCICPKNFSGYICERNDEFRA